MSWSACFARSRRFTARIGSSAGAWSRPWGGRRRPHASRRMRACSARPASARCAASRCSPRRTSSRRAASSRDDVDEPSRSCRRGASSRSTATSASSTTRRSITSTTSSVPPCAEFNFAKRTELADLRGRVALLTGGRVKIGYQAGIKLLRAGAHLIVTTRFPRDSAARYAREPDFADWARPARDLRARPAPHAERRGVLPRAARHARPPRLHRQQRLPDRAASARFLRAHDGRARTAALHDMPEHVRRLLGALRGPARLPPAAGSRRRARTAALDVVGVGRDGPDARRAAVAGAAAARRSSRRRSDLFPAGPARPGPAAGRPARAQLLAPAAGRSARRSSCSRCSSSTPSRRSSSTRGSSRSCCAPPERDKHIVNVSAVEGQFYRNFKTTRHPHTNMAKAALNMMTRTSAADYHSDGIHMNSVDTGWVTDEDPGGDRRAQDRRAPLPSAARHRRRRRAHRRSDHLRLQHRRARLGASS